MEGFFKIAREIGPLGALALLLLVYVAAAGTEGNIKEWSELGFRATIDHDPNRIVVVAAAVLVLLQAAGNSRSREQQDKRHSEELALAKERSEFNLQKVQSDRDAAIADAMTIRTQLAGDQALADKRGAEWHKLEGILRGHHALSNEDDPRFVSRVVQSAYGIREELGQLQNSGELEPPTREIILNLRWTLDGFLAAVEDIEYKTRLNLREADMRIDAISDHESSFRTAHNVWRERVNMLLRGVYFGRGEVNFIAL